MRPLLLCALFLPACAYDSVQKGDFKMTAVRVGTDTQLRQMEDASSGLKYTVVGENNSASFRETASVAKFYVGYLGLKSIVSGATESYKASQVTQQKAASEATKQVVAKEATAQASIAAEAATAVAQ